MLFSNQLHSPKPRSGADVPGLAALAKRAPIPGERERASRIGDMLMGLGAGAAVKCANPGAVRPPADDERAASRIATGKFISPPILRAIQKSPSDPQGSDHFTEPNPRPSAADLDFLWSPAVSPDLRANLIHAVKERHGAERIGSPDIMLAWDNSVSDLKAAIQELRGSGRPHRRSAASSTAARKRRAGADESREAEEGCDCRLQRCDQKIPRLEQVRRRRRRRELRLVLLRQDAAPRPFLRGGHQDRGDVARLDRARPGAGEQSRLSRVGHQDDQEIRSVGTAGRGRGRLRRRRVQTCRGEEEIEFASRPGLS
jgi:hypothetical protein